MNETTILENQPLSNGQQETKKAGSAWKQVTLGGVSGILMGAGLVYASQAIAKEPGTEDAQDVEAPEQGETSHTLENGLKVAAVSDDLSFGEAFAQARAEVGPGGVFHWHGGIYNTYSVDEWNAMTVEQKHNFAQQVQPEIRPDEIATPTDANPHVVVEHHVYHHEGNPSTEVHQATQSADDDVHVVSQNEDNDSENDDVRIVGRGEISGHEAVALDVDNDGEADVAIIDVNDNGDLDDDDVLVDTQGHVARYGELRDEPDLNQMASMENPDVAPDMPDYMNDVMVEA